VENSVSCRRDFREQEIAKTTTAQRFFCDVLERGPASRAGPQTGRIFALHHREILDFQPSICYRVQKSLGCLPGVVGFGCFLTLSLEATHR
jgi:hypothetical protein